MIPLVLLILPMILPLIILMLAMILPLVLLVLSVIKEGILATINPKKNRGKRENIQERRNQRQTVS